MGQAQWYVAGDGFVDGLLGGVDGSLRTVDADDDRGARLDVCHRGLPGTCDDSSPIAELSSATLVIVGRLPVEA